MIASLYVDWENKKILTRKEFKELLDKTSDRLFEDGELFDEYLEKHFTHIDLFHLTEEEKEAIQEDFHKHCDGYAEEYLRDNGDINYEPINIIFD